MKSDPESLFNGKDPLSLPANRKSFAVLRDWIDGIAAELDIPEKVRKKLLIAADEVFTNICCYACLSKDDLVTVSVEYETKNDCLALTFVDSGIPFNPLTTPEPDRNPSPEERPIGGWGIFLVRQFMDSVEYRRENDRNTLVLRKTLSCDDKS